MRAILLLVLLAGCKHTPPEPFVLGEEVAPPMGCEQARREGRDVDC